MRCIILRKRRIVTLFNIIIAVIVAVSLGITVIAVERSDSQGFAPIRRVDSENEAVALTVNVYENDDIDDYIRVFKNEKATFFISEYFQETYPEKVKEIYENGYSIGILLDSKESCSKNELYDILSVRIERMARIIGRNVDLVRFNAENCDSSMIKNIYALGLFPIQWKDSADDFSNGDILLITDLSSSEMLMKKTAAEGLTTATVNEIIIKSGFKVDCNGTQSSE